MTLLDHTVWGKHALDRIPRDWRPIVRWLLPITYGVNAICYGFFGTRSGGSRVMQQYLSDTGAIVLAGILALSSLVAFIGVSLCRDRIERIGAGVVIVGAVAYLGLLSAGLLGQQPPAGAFASTFAFGTGLIVRVLYLSRKIGRAKRRSRRA
jgi:hypothetical protein